MRGNEERVGRTDGHRFLLGPRAPANALSAPGTTVPHAESRPGTLIRIPLARVRAASTTLCAVVGGHLLFG